MFLAGINLLLLIGIYGTETNVTCLGGGTTSALACWDVVNSNWEIARTGLPTTLNDMVALNNIDGSGLDTLAGGWDASGTNNHMWLFGGDSRWYDLVGLPLDQLNRSAPTILYVGGKGLVVGGREPSSQPTYVLYPNYWLQDIGVDGGFEGYGVSITNYGITCAVGVTTLCFNTTLGVFVKGPSLIAPRQYAGKIVITGQECVVGGFSPYSTYFVNSIECPIDAPPSNATNGFPWQWVAIDLDYGFIPDTPGTQSFSLDGLSCVSLLYQQTTRVLCIDGNNFDAGWQTYPSPPLYLQGGLVFDFHPCPWPQPEVPPWCSCEFTWDCFASCTCQPRPPETAIEQSQGWLFNCAGQWDFYDQSLTCVSNIPQCLAVGSYLSGCLTCGCMDHFFLNCTCNNNPVQTQPYDVRQCISGMLNYSLTDNALVCDESANYALGPNFAKTICVADTVDISSYLLFQRDSMSEQLCAAEATIRKMRWFAVKSESCYAWLEYDPQVLSAMTAVSCNGDPSTMYAISETVTFNGCPHIPQEIQNNCTCTNPRSCDLNCTCQGTDSYLPTTDCSGGFTLIDNQVVCLPPSPNISTYIGCYAHDVTWTMPSLTRLVIPSATVDACMQAAILNNFNVFGMENGYECFGMGDSDAFAFAGNQSYASDQTYTSVRNCDGPGCNGGWTHFSSGCGAYNLMSLYTVDVKSLLSPTASYLGCYRDHNPNLGGGWYQDDQMGVAACAMQAKAAGKRVFGIEVGHECYMFDSLEEATQLGISDNCDFGCAGRQTPEFTDSIHCGGGWALSVFTLDEACPLTKFWYSNFGLTDMTTQLPACPYVLYPGQSCQPVCAAGFDNAFTIPEIRCTGGEATIGGPSTWLAFDYPPLCLPGQQFNAIFTIEGWWSTPSFQLTDNNYLYYWNLTVQGGNLQCKSTDSPSGWFWFSDCNASTTIPFIENSSGLGPIAWKIQSQVVVSTPAIYSFQWGMDCDFGVGMEVDGVLQQSAWYNMWWDGSFVDILYWDAETNKGPGTMTVRHVLPGGTHVFTGYCFEGPGNGPEMGSISIEAWKPEKVHWAVVGCFQKRPSDPILQTPILNSYTMYPSLCAAEAAALGYSYFAITNAYQCWGGNNNISSLVPSTCEKTCTDKTQCGGVNSWTLFSTLEYPGCAVEEGSDVLDRCTCGLQSNTSSPCLVNCYCNEFALPNFNTTINTLTCARGAYDFNGNNDNPQLICTSVATAPVTYAGCFPIPPTQLNNLLFFSNPPRAMSVDGCANLAQGGGFPYFALTQGIYCWGLSTAQVSAVTAAAVPFATRYNCNTSCVGGLTGLDNGCGGPGSLASVYVFDANFASLREMGCFGAGTAVNAQSLVITDTHQTVASCALRATALKSGIFGLTGSQCLIPQGVNNGYTLSQLGTQPSCSFPCPGKGHAGGTDCGNATSLSVFAFAGQYCSLTGLANLFMRGTCPLILQPGTSCQPACIPGYSTNALIPALICTATGTWLDSNIPLVAHSELCTPGVLVNGNYQLETRNYDFTKSGTPTSSSYRLIYNSLSTNCSNPAVPWGWFTFNNCSATPNVPANYTKAVNLAYHISSTFTLLTPANISFRWGIDTALGGILLIDGVQVKSHWGKMSWAGDWTNGLESRAPLGSGFHTVEGFAFEISAGSPQTPQMAVLLSDVPPPTPDFSLVSWPSNVYPGSWTTLQWRGQGIANWTLTRLGVVEPIRNYAANSVQLPPFTLTPSASYLITLVVPGITYTQTLRVVDYPLTVRIDKGVSVSLCPGDSVRVTWDTPSGISLGNIAVAWTGACLTNQRNGLQGTVDPTFTGSSCAVTAQVTPQGNSQPSVATIQMDFVNGIVCGVVVSGSSSVNPGVVLKLLASAANNGNSQTLTFQWNGTNTNDNSALSSTCFVPLGSMARTLVVSSSCLQQGVSYLFTVIVAAAGAQTKPANSSLLVYVRLQPYGGICQAHQPDPNVLHYTATCSGWLTDSSFPLNYALTSTLADGSMVRTLTAAQISPTFPFDLLPGSQNLTFTISTAEGSSTTYTSIVSANGQCSNAGSSQSVLTVVQASYGMLCNRSSTALSQLTQSINASLNVAYVAPALVPAIGEAISVYVTLAPASSRDNAFYSSVTGYVNQISNATELGDSTVFTSLSQALSPVLSDAPCQSVNSILPSLNQLGRRSIATTLPGETTSAVTNGYSSFASVSQFNSDTSSLNTQSLAVQIPAGVIPLSTTSDGSQSDVSQLSLTSYSPDLARCRGQSSTQQLLTPVVDVVVSQDGTEVPLTGISHPLTLTFVASRPQCGKAVCAWWDASSSTWSQSGCSGTRANEIQFTCSCNHLTEFSLLLTECPTPGERAGYAVLLTAYILTGLFALVRLVAKLYYHRGDRLSRTVSNLNRPKKSRWDIPHTQHTLIVILCTLRALSCATLGQFLLTNVFEARAALLLAPYLVVFWIYTVLAFNWAGLYHFGMSKDVQGQRCVRILFLITNIGVVIIVSVLLFLLLGPVVGFNSSPSNTNAIVALAALLVVLTLLTAVAFAVYCTLLYKSMHLSAVSSTTQSCSLAIKLLVFGIVASTLLVIQSALHLLGAAQSTSQAYAAHTPYLVLLATDILLIIAVLGLYHKFMNRAH